MLFERFEDVGLSQYSFAVGCPAAGVIAIVDPRRDCDVYLDFASGRGLRIAYVLETHIHADFASGALELAERSGAELCLSAYDVGEKYEVAIPHTALEDGDGLRMGSVDVRAIHTPGHTPEHLSYLIYDRTRAPDVPQLMLSGDFLFVGSLGRPDLLGEAAKQALAERLYDSVRTTLPALPDGLEVHPGHGAGSMCGAGMSARPLTTLGFERIANPYLDPALSRQAFIDRILGSSPPFPPYYRRMKTLNAAGPPPFPGVDAVTEISADRLEGMIGEGAIVVDVRDAGRFAAGHVAGALNVAAGSNLSTWAAWVVPYERPIVLVVADPATLEPSVRALARVGLDDVAGYLHDVGEWAASGRPLRQLDQIDVHQLADQRERYAVLDVRADDEWAAGHIEGAVHVMAGLVAERLDEVPNTDRPLAIICGTGYRSTVAASVLARAGVENLVNVRGGMQAWRNADLPVVAA